MYCLKKSTKSCSTLRNTERIAYIYVMSTHALSRLYSWLILNWHLLRVSDLLMIMNYCAWCCEICPSRRTTKSWTVVNKYVFTIRCESHFYYITTKMLLHIERDAESSITSWIGNTAYVFVWIILAWACIMSITITNRIETILKKCWSYDQKSN